MQVSKYDAFSCADEFNFVATNNENMQYDRKLNDNSCFDNKSQLNGKTNLFQTNQSSIQIQETPGQQHIEESKQSKRPYNKNGAQGELEILSGKKR